MPGPAPKVDAAAARRATIMSKSCALAASIQARGIQVARAAAGEDGQPSNTAELWLYGVVGGYWFGFNAASVADALRGLDVENLTVRLHSPGGNAIDGIAIANLLRNHKANVTMVIDGLAASAASVIALAGDDVVMSPGSQMMLHDPWMLTVGNAAELRSDAEFLDKQAVNYAALYAGKAGGTSATWRETMLADLGRGTWYTDAEAVEAGLADRVGTVQTTTPPPAEPVEDDFDDDDEMNASAAWDLEVLVHPAARAAWSSHPSAPHRPPSASAHGQTHTKGAAVVDLNDEQIKSLQEQVGFDDDADAATIVGAVLEALEERAGDTPPGTPSVPEGHVVIPAAKLADLEAGAKLATTTAKTLADKERDAFLDSVKDKYLPTSRAGWAAEYDRDPAGTRAHFTDAPVLIPTSEVGHGDNVDQTPVATDAELEAVAAGFGLTLEALK